MISTDLSSNTVNWELPFYEWGSSSIGWALSAKVNQAF